MEFSFSIKIGGNTIYIKAIKLKNIGLREYWALSLSDGTKVELSNNRPLFISKNLKHRAPMWKIESGSLKYANTLTDISVVIEKEISKQKKS